VQSLVAVESIGIEYQYSYALFAVADLVAGGVDHLWERFKRIKYGHTCRGTVSTEITLSMPKPVLIVPLVLQVDEAQLLRHSLFAS
jgi:hypothetical protein